MKVLGIDPGVGRMGFAVIESKGNELNAVSYGLISTPAGTAHPKRLKQIFDDLNEIIEKYNPDLVSVETLVFVQNITTGMSVSEARGIVLLCAELHEKEVVEFTPLQIKQCVTGFGQAKKAQIQKAVQMLLSLPEIPKPDDTADAIAAAITALSSSCAY